MREDWIECTFEDLTLSLKRGPFGGDLKKMFFVESGFPVYEQQHAINDDFSNIRYYIDDDRFQKLKACNVGQGDYIVSCSGTMGKIARLPMGSTVGVINQALLRIRLNDQFIHHNFFLQFFKSSIFQKKILKDSRGSGMQNMAGIKELKPISVSIPPLPEQRAIVVKIEELFSSLDSGIADLKKAQDQLKIYRQAVLKKAFEGELTKEWRAKQTNLPTADELLEQIKEERQNHYNKQVEDWKQAVKEWEGNDREGKKPTKPRPLTIPDAPNKDHLARKWVIPNNWLWTQLGTLCFVTKLAGFEYTDYVNYDDEGDLPVLKAENAGPLGFKKTDFSKVKSDSVKSLVRSQIFGGELLIVFVGAGTGNVAMVPLNQRYFLGPNIGMARPYLNLNSKYLELLLQSALGKNLMMSAAKAVAQPSLSMGTIRQSPIAYPSIEEQHQIVQEIESRLSVCDKVEEIIVESLVKAKALRQSILKKAFEGKLLNDAEIASCKSEEDYEPAYKLLERIYKIYKK